MTTNAPWRAAAGDTFDNEGFPIITSASTLRAHVGKKAGLWPESWPFTSSVDALVHEDGRIELFRDGKGDTLEFDLNAAKAQSVSVCRSGTPVGKIRVFSDGESGYFYADGSTYVSEFPRITTGLVALGNSFLI